MGTKIHSRQIRQVTEEDALNLFADSAIAISKLLTNATKEDLDFLHGVTSNVQNQINNKLNSSLLKGSENVSWNDDTIAVTALAVADKIASEIASANIGQSVFKGGWSTSAATEIKQGWSYVYDSGTAPTGLSLESGDYLTAKVDITTADMKADSANWVVVQANISGAVTTVEDTLTSGCLLVGNGGKSIKLSLLTGLLAATNGVLRLATASDLPAHTHNRNINVNGTNYSLTTADVLSLVSSGGGAISYDNITKKITITFPTIPSLSGGGSAPAGSYVESVNVSGHAILLGYKPLPTIPAATGSVYKTNQVPTGTKNGTNVTFTLADNIVATTLTLYLNGQALVQGVDYTLSGTGNKTITFASDSNIPLASDSLTASYVVA